MISGGNAPLALSVAVNSRSFLDLLVKPWAFGQTLNQCAAELRVDGRIHLQPELIREPVYGLILGPIRNEPKMNARIVLTRSCSVIESNHCISLVRPEYMPCGSEKCIRICHDVRRSAIASEVRF